jgi:hypothetical protein
MIGFLISEYIPNTFFSRKSDAIIFGSLVCLDYYDNGLGIVRESLRAESVPNVLKGIARLVCANCELQLIANLTGYDRFLRLADVLLQEASDVDR